MSETRNANASPSPTLTRSTRRLMLMGGLLLLAAAVALVLYGEELVGGRNPAGNGSASSFEPLEVGTPRTLEPPVSVGPAPQPGETAPPFVLPDLQDEEVSLAQFRGQPVILNFWATWCAPCIFEMPELQAAYEEHKGDGLVILGLNRDEAQAAVTDFLANDLDVSIDFPILLDDHAVVADSYGVLNMPTTYFIDGEGNVSAVHRGPLTREQIDDFLADMS